MSLGDLLLANNRIGLIDNSIKEILKPFTLKMNTPKDNNGIFMFLLLERAKHSQNNLQSKFIQATLATYDGIYETHFPFKVLNSQHHLPFFVLTILFFEKEDCREILATATEDECVIFFERIYEKSLSACPSIIHFTEEESIKHSFLFLTDLRAINRSPALNAYKISKALSSRKSNRRPIKEGLDALNRTMFYLKEKVSNEEFKKTFVEKKYSEDVRGAISSTYLIDWRFVLPDAKIFLENDIPLKTTFVDGIISRQTLTFSDKGTVESFFDLFKYRHDWVANNQNKSIITSVDEKYLVYLPETKDDDEDLGYPLIKFSLLLRYLK